MEVANHAPQTSVRRTPVHVGDTYTALENCTVYIAHCKFHISQCKAQTADAGVGQSEASSAGSSFSGSSGCNKLEICQKQFAQYCPTPST